MWRANRRDRRRWIHYVSMGKHIFDSNYHRHTLDLTSAVWRNSPAGVELALDRGADPNAMDEDGRTPLHRALDTYCSTYKTREDRQSALCMVRLLLSSGGAPAKRRSEDGLSCLGQAVIAGRLGVADIMLKHDKGRAEAAERIDFMDRSLLALCSSSGDHHGLRFLLDRAGGDANARADGEDSAALIHLAVVANKAKAVEVLLERRADPLARCGRGGLTPLELAASIPRTSREVISHLLDWGSADDDGSGGGKAAAEMAISMHSDPELAEVIWALSSPDPNCEGGLISSHVPR